ncbi:hypothetical protein [Devosia sp.]|uniref:hypothetical protein n=1 Tax=Devosia sp. TaxID=1871048 RepID=UPI002FC6618F
MEFHVTLAGLPPEVSALEIAFRAIDPAAIVDWDPTGRTLRIAAAVNAADVGALLAREGYSVSPDRIQPQPSICCGSCSG